MYKGLIFLFFALFFSPQMSLAASFDCKSARKVDEQTICSTPKLKGLDIEMSVKYHFLRGLFPMGRASEMADTQAQWVKSRRLCQRDTSCLQRSYQQRIAVLDEIYAAIPKPI